MKWCDAEGVNPARATEDDVIAYRKHLVDAGLKRSTLALKLAVVRRLYEAARWRGLRQDNPALGVKAPRDRTTGEERAKYLPLQGLKRLLEAPVGVGVQAARHRAILALMGVHGLRVAEVAGLCVHNVDLGRGAVSVEGKGQKRRSVYLTEQTGAVLADWLAMRRQVARPDTAAAFVVTGHRCHGEAISTRGIRHLVDKYLSSCGLKREGVSCHSLRHSAATWARAGGAKLDSIAGMLGHSSTTTTEVYAKIVDNMGENPALYLETLIGAQRSSLSLKGYLALSRLRPNALGQV